MLNATLNKKKSRDKIIGIGFKKGVYFSNVKYLFIQQYLYFIPLIIAFIFALLTIEVLSDFRDVVNIILFLGFIVLSAAISLMLAMTPYLLADDRFDQTKYNPVIFSAKILKGSYVKLIAIRLFFAPWLLLVLTSSVLAYMNVFSDGGSERLPGGIPVLLISLATTFLIIQPLYHLMHAALYYDIRDNIKKYI